ncbi:MAG: hypothetical protein WAT71_04145 [Ignavibacteria bacterium]
MIKSPAIEILKAFSKDEYKRFAEFAESPYFNKNSNLLKAVKFIKKISPVFDGNKLTDEKIWTAVFGKRDFNYGVMKNLTHELRKLTDKFISIEMYSKNELQINFDILQYAKFKSLPEIFEKSYANILKKHEDKKLTFDNYLYMYKAMDVNKTFKAYFGKLTAREIQRGGKCMDELTYYFFSVYFYNSYCEITESLFYNFDSDHTKFRIFTDFYGTNYYGKDLLSDIFYNAVMMFLESDSYRYFLDLKNLFYKNFNKLHTDISYDIGAILTTYCVLSKPVTGKNFVQEEFDILYYLFKNNILKHSSHKYLDSNLFSKFADYCIVLNKPELCGKLIEKFRDQLNPVNGEIRIQIADSHLQNYLKKYDKALNIISKSKPGNCDEKLKMRGIELIVNFNIKNYETVYTLIRNFRSFIEYEKVLTKLHRIIFINFLNYLKKITDIITGTFDSIKTENELSTMLLKISNEKVANRKWLISVMNEMYEKNKRKSSRKKKV